MELCGCAATWWRPGLVERIAFLRSNTDGIFSCCEMTMSEARSGQGIPGRACHVLLVTVQTYRTKSAFVTGYSLLVVLWYWVTKVSPVLPLRAQRSSITQPMDVAHPEPCS